MDLSPVELPVAVRFVPGQYPQLQFSLAMCIAPLS